MDRHAARPRLVLGRLVATPGALTAFERNGQTPIQFLHRHQRDDWGKVDAEDWAANNMATAHEGDPNQQRRVVSAYDLDDRTRIWIITERDRSLTTILLPEEY